MIEMSRLGFFLFGVGLSVAGVGDYAVAAPGASGASAIGAPLDALQLRKKQPGDVSYQTMWRMQKRVSALLPRHGELITPVLRLALSDADERERNEFLPSAWGMAIMGKTIDTVLPIRRGGYFEVPAIPHAQARSEEAIVRFNVQQKKKWFDVAWQVAVPDSGVMPYGQLAQAFDELKLVQKEIAWWDILLMEEKNARFNAVRACFEKEGGTILVGGATAGTPLSRHCSLLPFNRADAAANASVAFVGALTSVTLDKTEHYANEH